MPYTVLKAERDAAHQRLRRKRGRASTHRCCIGDDHPAEHWSHIHETDFMDLENYRPMCAAHHREYDRPTREHLKGRKYTDEQRKRVSEGRKKAWANKSKEERQAAMQKINPDGGNQYTRRKKS